MTTSATPNLFCECPDDRCAGFHHDVGDPCGCFLLPLACAVCGHETDAHPRAGACGLCTSNACQPIDTDADAEADAVATLNALILPDAFGDDAPATPDPLPDVEADAGQPGATSDRPAPSCPSWCTEAAEHAAEAADPFEESYLHAGRLGDDASPYCVEVVAWQRFAGGVVEPAGVQVWTDHSDLTGADARELARLLVEAAVLVEGVSS